MQKIGTNGVEKCTVATPNGRSRNIVYSVIDVIIISLCDLHFRLHIAI